jgi:PAS domain S-box-containing protein
LVNLSESDSSGCAAIIALKPNGKRIETKTRAAAVTYMGQRSEDFSESPFWRYGLAITSCLVFLALKLATSRYLGDTVPFVLFFSAVMISAWFGGLGPGILATALCTSFAYAFFLHENLSFWAKFWPLIAFAAEGASIGILSQSRRRVLQERTAVLQRERAAREHAEQVGRELNDALQKIIVEKTERKEAENLASTILETITDAFFAVNRDWRFNYVNPQAERILGRSPGDLLGKEIWEAYPGLVGSDFEPVYRRAMQERIDGSVTSFYPDHDRWYEVHVYPTPDGISIYFRDVSESKRAEAEQQRLSAEVERQARVFDTTLSSITDFVYILDREARFLYVNKALLDLWGLKLEEALGKDFFDLKYPRELAEKLAAQVRQVFETKKGLSDETPYVSPSGAAGFYEYIFSPVFAADGKVEVIAGSTRDVTERKRSVEQLRQAAAEREEILASERAARNEAERASRMKDEFLATLSHELRTPLNAILGWSRILASDWRSQDDLAEGLATIERNARAQTQIIEDLLDMSRIISGKVRFDVQRVDLGSVVRAAAEAVKPAADSKGVRLQLVLDPQAGPISGDPNRLQQVFWNLLTNAVKFTPRGGRVQVLLERVNSHLELSVTDTGEGINPEFLPHVFDRFRQSDPSTTRRHGGLGIGLAIVKQLVELHGGSVRATSPGVGHGATFTISLPVSAVRSAPRPSNEDRRHPSAADSAVAMDRCADLTGVKVLVVDDEPDARALVKRLLEECGAAVILAGSAEEAVQKVRTDRPDVIASDIGMPALDGYSLMSRIRALSPENGGETPALALTAYARAEDRVKAVMAGFQHHVSKPVEPAELIAMVASLAGRARNHPENRPPAPEIQQPVER